MSGYHHSKNLNITHNVRGVGKPRNETKQNETKQNRNVSHAPNQDVNNYGWQLDFGRGLHYRFVSFRFLVYLHPSVSYGIHTHVATISSSANKIGCVHMYHHKSCTENMTWTNGTRCPYTLYVEILALAVYTCTITNRVQKICRGLTEHVAHIPYTIR